MKFFLLLQMALYAIVSLSCSSSKNLTTVEPYQSINPVRVKNHTKWYEVDWNQGVKLCPENNLDAKNGFWIVNGTSHVDSSNCVYIDGSPYTRSILARFMKNDLDDADSSWILVNQTIVNLKGKTFTVYSRPEPTRSRWTTCTSAVPKCRLITTSHLKQIGGVYECAVKDKSYSVTMKYDLIVDKTELRVRDALWLREGNKVHEKDPVINFTKDYYPSSDSLDVLDYPAEHFFFYTGFRSKKDGLELIETCNIPGVRRCTYNINANGYRLPYYDEWYILQTGGSSKIFAWGNDFAEDSLKQYADIHCADRAMGLYPVKQYAPNRYGLYDVYGNAEEQYSELDIKDSAPYMRDNPFCRIANLDESGRACQYAQQYKCFKRKADLTHRSQLNSSLGFQGSRMVRILE